MSETYLSRDHKKLLAKELFDDGKTKTEISVILNIPRSTISDWIDKTRKTITTTTVVEEVEIDTNQQDDEDVYVPRDPLVDVLRRKTFNAFEKSDKNQELAQTIRNLTPIQYSAPEKPKILQRPNKIALVIGDIHFGLEHWPTLYLFLEAVRELKPEHIILNGDTLDMFAISKYPKDIRYKQSLLAERESYHRFLKLLHDVSEPFQSKISETNANHSGNSTEGRLWRYLSAQLGELAELAKDELSYENLFFPKEDWSRIQLVDEVILPTNFIIYHGTVVRKGAAMSARGEWEKKMTSTMTNHTHRMGMHSRRIPAAGNRGNVFHTNYENGCACNLDPDYAPFADWQNGFSIINYTEEVIGVEPVVVYENKATICSLGKTLRV